MRRFGQARRRYHFTPALLEALRRAYAGGRVECRAGLDRLEAETGWPRWAFRCEARKRGWTRDVRRRWTAEELEYVGEHAGELSARRLAMQLGRTVESVSAAMERVGLSRRIRAGYSLTDLGQCLGVSPHKVRRWVDRGLLGRLVEERISQHQVTRFLRACTDEYDLRRVDQFWFKAMVFGMRAMEGER